MEKESATAELEAERQLEQNITTLQQTLANPHLKEPPPHSATKAKQACKAINATTAELRDLLYGMFGTTEKK